MIDPWFLEHLACPVDKGPLSLDGRELVCGSNHRYPVVDGVPVMLRSDIAQTIDIADASLRRARDGQMDPRSPDLHLESLGISEDEKQGVLALAATGGPIDPVVAYLVAATNGLMYRHLIGHLDRYPIPELPLPAGQGRVLLDIGCSWGRWTLAADRKGYAAVGMDPSLGAVMAARRVARQLGAPTRYLVGDARHLPFGDAHLDQVFSYSVLQHFSRADAAQAVVEIGRVLAPGGRSTIQMPTRFGIRCLYHQVRRGFSDGTGFDVRYWTLPELRRLFARAIGATRFAVDCYFGIGLQASDAHLMTPGLRAIISASETLKRVSRRLPILIRIADSVFVESSKAA